MTEATTTTNPVNYSHMMTITLPEGLNEEEFIHASNSLKKVLDGQPMVQDVGGGGGARACIVWRFSHLTPEMDVVFVTDVQGMLGDTAVFNHTQNLIKAMDLCRSEVVLSKPLSHKMAME